MQNKRVFISGGAGVIGTHLVDALIRAGADIFVGDLKPCPKAWLGKVKYRQGDLNSISQEELLDFSPHYFFHLAATFERSVETFPFFNENFHHNLQLSHHLINCLKDSPDLLKVIFASSYLIYDPKLYESEKPLAPVMLNENSFTYPRNICGAAKFFHEQELQFIRQFADEQLSIISARIFRVYGKNSRDVISRWIRMALLGEPLTVYLAEGHFDYIYAEDVAKGLIKLCDSTSSGIVNLGSGHARSIREVLAILKRNFPNLQWQEEASEQLLESSQADMRKFHEITSWMPEFQLEKAIPLLIEYEKNKLNEQPEPTEHNSVLVTSISKKVPLLQAVRNATEKLGHFKSLFGCDTNKNCIGQYAVDTFWNCPKLKEIKLEDFVDYCNDNKIKALIPTRDGELHFFAQNKDVFKRNGIHVMVSASEVVQICLDKLLFAKKLKEANFISIQTTENIDDIKTDLFVVKERFGAGSDQIGLRLNKREAIEHGKKLASPIYQPFLEGQEYSVDVYRSQSGKVMGCVVRERNLVIDGESHVTTTVSFPELEKIAHDLSCDLGLEGHAIFQVILDKQGQSHVIECNPRFGGASTASLAVGLDSFYWFLLEASGQSIDEYAFFRSKKEIRQVRHAADWILPW